PSPHRHLPSFPTRRSSDLQSSHNWPVRLGQHFSKDRLRVLLVEGDDARPLRWQRAAQLLPSERRLRRTPTRLEPSGILLEFSNQDRKSTRLNSSHLVISYA